MTTDCSHQLTFWDIGRQQITLDFDGGCVVSDAGLLPIRLLDRELGVLAEVAQRLPDPHAQKFVSHSRQTLLTQEVYQILAGYPDGNDAQALRDDPLFQTLVGVSPNDERSLASGSTLNRFHHASTRRQAELPLEECPVLREIDTALTQRLNILNDYLPELFIRTRRTPPPYVILDIDPSDDPTHGQHVLSFFHDYYDQHPYFPVFVFDGNSDFPLAAWLRPGTVPASCGAVATLQPIVRASRAAWPDLTILVGGDSGLATPEVYEFCALVVLHRKATASIPEVAHAEMSTLRQRLWKVGAVVKTRVRRIWFHVSTNWPKRRLFERVCVAVRQFLEGLRREVTVLPNAGLLPLL